MLRTVRTMLLVGALPILSAGCAQTPSSADSVCSPWRSITWSKKDTPETVDQVKGNNARRGAWCGGA